MTQFDLYIYLECKKNQKKQKKPNMVTDIDSFIITFLSLFFKKWPIKIESRLTKVLYTRGLDSYLSSTCE